MPVNTISTLQQINQGAILIFKSYPPPLFFFTEHIYIKNPFQILFPYVYVCALSHVQLFAAPWTVAHQAPLSTEFPVIDYYKLLGRAPCAIQ